MTDASTLFAEVVARLGRPRSATYRFQLGPSLGFDHVTALAPYLDDLGITEGRSLAVLRLRRPRVKS